MTDILTDEGGVPFPRPRRDEYASDGEYVRAHHAYNDAVSAASRRGIDLALTRVNVTEFQLAILRKIASGTLPLAGVLGRRRGPIIRACERMRLRGFLRFRARSRTYALTPSGRAILKV